MVNAVRVKPGVEFTVIAPGGFVILHALLLAAWAEGHDVTITSACDGEHSGPDDPHHRGEAYDVRSQDIADKVQFLYVVKTYLPEDRFFAFLEDAGTDNEHFHIQVKKGTEYP